MNKIMNKKVMKATFIAAIVMMTGINVFNAQKSESMSDIALANVEALAETEKSKYSVFPCPDSYGNECNTAVANRPACSVRTYCR